MRGKKREKEERKGIEERRGRGRTMKESESRSPNGNSMTAMRVFPSCTEKERVILLQLCNMHVATYLENPVAATRALNDSTKLFRTIY